MPNQPMCYNMRDGVTPLDYCVLLVRAGQWVECNKAGQWVECNKAGQWVECNKAGGYIYLWT